MNRDELILEIIEKVHEQSQNTAKDVKDLTLELKQLSIEVAKQGELHKINASNLDEHMARTAANEERVLLIEKHVMFVNSVIKVVTAIGAITLFVLKVLPFLSNLATNSLL